MKKAMINKIICASLVLGVVSSTTVVYATPNTKVEEGQVTTVTTENAVDDTTQIKAGTQDSSTEKTGTVRVNTYYTPLDLKYNTPMYYYTPGNTGWKTTSERMELDLEHTYEKYNPDTQNWEPISLTQTMPVGKYRVIPNSYYTPIMSPQEFTVAEGAETSVNVEYTNVDVPTTLTVVSKTDSVQVEGLKYIIRNDTGELDKGAELKSGTVENGKISFTLESDALYTIEFTNGELSTSPTLFSVSAGADGTYSNEITIYDFLNPPTDDEDVADDEGDGNTPVDGAGETPNEGSAGTKNSNVPKTSAQGRDFALMTGILSLLGLGFIYGRKKELI